MSINTTGNNESALQAARSNINKGNTQAQPQPQQDNQTSSKRWSFHSAGAFTRSPINRDMGSEVLGRIREAAEKEYKDTQEGFETKLISIDNANRKPRFSCLVVTVRDKKDKVNSVAFHTLIIEASGDLLPPIPEQMPNKTIEIFRVTGDAYDSDLMEIVGNRVSAEFPGANLYSALATVVPSSFNVEDKHLVKELVLSAGLACSTELDLRKPSFMDFDLANYVADSKLVVTLGFSNQQVQNAVGMPIRSDVNVKFTSQENRNSNVASINTGDRIENVSNLSGFIDLIYSPAAQQINTFGQQNNQQNAPTQCYGARLVVTMIDSSLFTTPACQVMALSTAMTVANRGNYMQAFRIVNQGDRRSDTRINMRDIGAIGIEVNANPMSKTPGKPFDTSIDNFRPSDLGDMINLYFHQGLVLSIDVPECGPETWGTSIFSAAASNTPGATEALLLAMNTLTHNHFEKYFPAGSPMFTDLGQRVHLGYYTDANNIRRDIRDYDYLAVANLLGERDPQQIRDWSDTFTTDYPLNERLAARKQIIQGLCPNAVFTGFAHRVTFRQSVTNALASAQADCGLDISIVAPQGVNDMNNQRGVGNFVNDALMSASAGRMYNSNNGRAQANNQYSTFGSRYQ